MAGGNTRSSKRPHDMLKWGSAKSPDVQALVGQNILANYPGLDTEYGLANYGMTPKGPIHGEPKMMKLGKPAMKVADRRGKGNPMAGKS